MILIRSNSCSFILIHSCLRKKKKNRESLKINIKCTTKQWNFGHRRLIKEFTLFLKTKKQKSFILLLPN